MRLLPAYYLLFLLSSFLACTDSNSPEEAATSPAQHEQTPTETANTQQKTKRIVFFGNSLSAAYGMDNIAQGFVGLIAAKLDSLGYKYEVVNAGLSGETTAGGRERVSWVLEQPVDIFVLELGGNDGLRGIDPASSYENLKAIIETVKAKYPDAAIVLAGMEAPPNMGQQFTQQFRQMYARLAQEYDTYLIPFLLEGVAGDKRLNLPDGIHPNVEGHRIVAENVWAVLQEVVP